MTKKLFIGQAVTGQDIKILQFEMEKITTALSTKDVEIYSTLKLEGKNNFKSAGDWVKHAFDVIDNSDLFLAILRTEHRIEGLLMEVGWCLSKKKKFILAIKDDVKNTYLRDMADEVIEFKDFNDLLTKLKNVRI